MTRRCVVVVVLCALAIGGAAHADKDKARTLTERGAKQYNLGEYGSAAEAFKAAYDEFPEPSLLFNLAQCERQLGHKARAVTLYRSYLREAPGAANGDEVRRLVRGLEEDLAREAQAPKPPARASAPPPAVVAVAPSPPPPRATRPWWRNGAGWTLVALGVGAGAAGGALLGAALADENAAPRAATLADARGKLDQAGTFRTAGLVLVGVGAASFVSGALVLALMPSRWKARAAIVPSTNGAMVAIGGAL